MESFKIILEPNSMSLLGHRVQSFHNGPHSDKVMQGS